MSDDYKTYETAKVAFQKLEPNPGDVIFIKFPDDIHPTQMQQFAEGLQEHIPEDVVILCARDSVDIQKIPESEMNKHGWFRFENTSTKQH